MNSLTVLRSITPKVSLCVLAVLLPASVGFAQVSGAQGTTTENPIETKSNKLSGQIETTSTPKPVAALTYERLSSLSTRIAVVLSRLHLKGVDTTGAETSLAKVNASLLIAKENLDLLKDLDPEGNDSKAKTKELNESFKVIRSQLIETLLSIKQSLTLVIE